MAVELKRSKFHPKDLGQLEFYLEALDRDVKRANENPSIGIILCPETDKTVVEYAMSRSMSLLWLPNTNDSLCQRKRCSSFYANTATWYKSRKEGAMTERCSWHI